MKTLRDFTTILHNCYQTYIDQFGKIDFDKTHNKITVSKSVGKLLELTIQGNFMPKGNDFVDCVHGIPFFIFSKWNRICLGGILALDRWNKQVNRYHNIASENDLIAALHKIIEYSRADYIDKNVIYKEENEISDLEKLIKIMTFFNENTSIVGLVRGEILNISYTSEHELFQIIIDKIIINENPYARIKIDINQNNSELIVPKNVLYTAFIESNFLDKKTTLKVKQIFLNDESYDETNNYYDLWNYMVNRYKTNISKAYPALLNNITIDISKKYGTEFIFRLKKGDEDPDFANFFYNEIIQSNEIENLKIGEVDAIVIIDQIKKTHAVYDIKKLEGFLPQ